MTFDPKTFDWHKAALAHITAGGSSRDPEYPKIWNDVAMTGTFAYRPSKTEPPKAVFFWYSTKEEGKLLCMINGERVGYGLDIWKSCAGRPIPRAVYDAYIESKVWPSEILVQLSDGSTDSSMVGHNSKGENSSLTKHKDDIKEWSDRANKILKAGAPTTQAEADTLADVKTKLADLVSAADKERESITKPLFRVYKDANEEWSSFIGPAQNLLPNMQRLLDNFIRAENKRREDEVRRLNEAEAAKAAAAAPASQAATATAPAEPAPVYEVVRVQVGTRKTIKAAKRRVVVFEDFKKAAMHFINMDPVPPEIHKAITDKAMVLLSAGVPVPGAKLDMEIVGK